MVKRTLTTKQKEIIRVLHKHGGSMSKYEISKKANISYATVNEHMKKLAKKGIVKTKNASTKKTSKKKAKR